jgi:nitroreductase
VDAYLAIASKRDQRSYADAPVPDEIAHRILEAGRVTGSGANRQPWTFVVVRDPDRKQRLAETVYEPGNVLGATLVVAIAVRPVGTAQLDAGRAAQNMMLAAWNDGVVSCPNGVADADAAERIVGAKPTIVISFGYPQTPRDPESRSAEEWSARAKRKPLDEVVRRV